MPRKALARVNHALVAAGALMLANPGPLRAAPISLYGAGSLSGALGTVAANFTATSGIAVNTTFQPSGTIRSEILAGTATPDLFASADTGNPLALEQAGLSGPVVDFASNRLVVVAAPGYNVTSSNLLATLLNPAITVGTSTPVYDPLGDYTEQVFADANAIDPGAQATLDAKAERLIADPTSPVVPAGDNSLVYFLDTTKQADVFITYYTSAVAALQIDPNLTEVELPGDLATSAEYGLTILDGANPQTQQLANYILSPAGQSVLATYDFGPPAASTSVPEAPGLAMFSVALIGLGAAKWRSRSGQVLFS